MDTQRRQTLKTFIWKRGYAKSSKQRILVAKNSVIEAGLGQYGIRCVADLIHELVTVGPYFNQANNFVCPFKLSSPLGGFSRKTKLLHFVEGGEVGARGEAINKLLKYVV